MSHSKVVTLSVTRSAPELISPAKTTPKELKDLSDLDKSPSCWFHPPAIQFYRKCKLAAGKDPVKVIKEAIAQTLVYYYPLAGRLRKIDGTKKLIVDCNAEGIMFVEAVANVSIDQFGDALYPPFTCVSELYFDSPGSMIDTPLLYFQVTRLKCGGFVVGVLFNHIMTDAAGFCQFMSTVGELARGYSAPSIPPVWLRHLFTFENTHNLTSDHSEAEHWESKKVANPFLDPKEGLVQSGFLFDSTTVSSLRELVAPYVPNCSSFELISAALWRSWTLALNLDPDAKVFIRIAVNTGNRFRNTMHNLKGYYGNLSVLSSATITTAELKANPLAHIVKLIQNAKNIFNEDYKASILNQLSVDRNLPNLLGQASFLVVSDIRWAGFNTVDYGWGKPEFGGAANPLYIINESSVNFIAPVKTRDGKNAAAVALALHKPVMDLFIKELNLLTGTSNVYIDRAQKRTTSDTDYRARL